MAVIIPAIVALASAGYGAYSSEKAKKDQKKAQKKAEAEMNAQPEYKGSENTNAMITDARARLSNTSPAAIAAYQQAQQQAANTAGTAQRVAGSGAEALSAAAGAQSRLNSVVPSLAGAQQEYEQQNTRNYMAALGEGANQDRAIAEDKTNRWGDRVNFNLGQAAAAGQNRGQSIALAANALGSLAGSGINWKQVFGSSTPGIANAGNVPAVNTAGSVLSATAQSGTQLTPQQLAALQRYQFAMQSGYGRV